MREDHREPKSKFVLILEIVRNNSSAAVTKGDTRNEKTWEHRTFHDFIKININKFIAVIARALRDKIYSTKYQ